MLGVDVSEETATGGSNRDAAAATVWHMVVIRTVVRSGRLTDERGL